MNKKLLALAIAAAFSAPVLADDSTVTLYGTLNADFEYVKATGASGVGANVPGRTRVSSNSSNIGVRGSEPLGGGLNAFFQVESSVALDQGGGTWASRNSGVGLNGGFGTILLGQWDSPYKVSTSRLDPFGNTTIGAYSAIMGGGGTATAGNSISTGVAAQTFDRRVQNTAQYWTPNLSGFSARVAYGANEEKTSDIDPKLVSVSAAYDGGASLPLYVAAAYEEHRDFASIAVGQGKDQAWKGGAAYTFANVVTLAGVYEQLKYKSDTTGDEAKIRNYFLALTGKFGPGSISGTFGQRRKVKFNGTDLDDTDARLFGLRLGYSLSKRTEFYAMGVRITNKANAAQNFAVNGLPSVAAGADPLGYGVGLIHKF